MTAHVRVWLRDEWVLVPFSSVPGSTEAGWFRPELDPPLSGDEAALIEVMAQDELRRRQGEWRDASERRRRRQALRGRWPDGGSAG